MNVPLYAAALFAVALLYLQLSVFLLPAIAVALLAMGVVLTVQLLLQRAAVVPGSDLPIDPAERSRRAAAVRAVAIDQTVTVAFVAVTWEVFVRLGPASVEFLGPGWTYPAVGSAGGWELLGWAGATVGLAAWVAVAWTYYARGEVVRRLRGRPAPRFVAMPLPEAGTACEFAAAYAFWFFGSPAPDRLLPDDHAGGFVRMQVPARGKLPGKEFALCGRHQGVFLGILGGHPAADP